MIEYIIEINTVNICASNFVGDTTVISDHMEKKEIFEQENVINERINEI